MFNLRIAISPSGVPHIGNYFIIIINYIIKNKLLGNIFLRFDNTNYKKIKNINKIFILNFLKKKGFFIKKILYQSKNIEFYNKIISKIFYKKSCFKKYFKNIKIQKKNIVYSKIFFLKNYLINYYDNNYGLLKILFKKNNFVIFKKNCLPTYVLSSVIDDYLNNIKLIIRGKEWLNQIFNYLILIEFFNLKLILHHTANINQINKKKYSKRFNNNKEISFNKIFKFKNKNIIKNITKNIFNNIFYCKKDNLLKLEKKKRIIKKKNNYMFNFINFINNLKKNVIENFLQIKETLNLNINNIKEYFSNINLFKKNVNDIKNIVLNLKSFDIKKILQQYEFI